jgi:hypothetical protein
MHYCVPGAYLHIGYQIGNTRARPKAEAVA